MIVRLLFLALSAVLIENFVFVKFYGICPFLGVSQKVETAVGMGFAVTFTMTVASALTYLLYEYVLAAGWTLFGVTLHLEYLETIAFILLIACLVQFIEMFLQKMLPALYASLGIYLPLITTNCAVLGVALLNIQKRGPNFGFIEATVYGFAAGIGFLLAIFLLALVRERMDETSVPKPFRGFPIALIAGGLIALAFGGFQGLTFPGV